MNFLCYVLYIYKTFSSSLYNPVSGIILLNHYVKLVVAKENQALDDSKILRDAHLIISTANKLYVHVLVVGLPGQCMMYNGYKLCSWRKRAKTHYELKTRKTQRKDYILKEIKQFVISTFRLRIWTNLKKLEKIILKL